MRAVLAELERKPFPLLTAEGGPLVIRLIQPDGIVVPPWPCSCTHPSGSEAAVKGKLRGGTNEACIVSLRQPRSSLVLYLGQSPQAKVIPSGLTVKHEIFGNKLLIP